MNTARVGMADASGLVPSPARSIGTAPYLMASNGTQRLLVDGIGPGAVIIQNTALTPAPAGSRFQWLFAHEPVVIATAAGDAILGGTLAGLLVPAGSYYRLPALSSITLSSGKATVYVA